MAWQDKCSSWRSRLAASRHDDDLNDVEFSVGENGVTVFANRAILAMASPVMKAQFYGPLSDQNNSIIPINDEMGTVRGFMAMIDFIYDEDKYSIKDLLYGREEITQSEDLAGVMELLFFADKYQIKSLICFCRNLLIHKIKLNQGNMFSMFNVICKYKVLDVDYQIVSAQIKVIESAIVDIRITEPDWPHYDLGATTHGYWKPNIYQLKFKVNQDALLLFDENKQQHKTYFHEYCETFLGESVFPNGETEDLHEKHFKSISWEPENGCREIAKGAQIKTTKFYAKANVEYILQLEVCQGTVDAFGSYGFENLSISHNGKFQTYNMEIEILEINGKVFKEAIMSDERMPMYLLSFQPLVAVVQ